jgi:UDP-N-acetylmuramate--alanine ligase
MFRGKVKQIHFVGIGGSGMCGIAEVLLNLGFKVTGSDLSEGDVVARLRALGAVIAIGHSRENVGHADVLVKSTAIPETNPELLDAHARHVPVIPRAEMLAELMRMKYGLAIAGTHGKTTTTSMLAQILAAANLDPTVVIGGRLDALGSNARMGRGDYLVAEADESDGSFMLLAPTVAVVTNIDPEHMEHYGTFEVLEQTFVDFANKVPFFGFAVLCLDHPTVQALMPRVRRRVVTYGLNRQAFYRAEDVQADGLSMHFNVARRGEILGALWLGMPGVHNVQNALAAVATASELDIPFSAIQQGLNGFSGVERRFTVRGEASGVTVIDDYGHHPVEIRATLDAARAAFPRRRLVAVFQPHRYSRVRDLAVDFCRSFNLADHVVIVPIYAAGERPIDGVNHQTLLQGLHGHGHRSAVAVESLDEAVDHLSTFVRSGDVVITLGAGHVNRCCGALLERMA